MPWCVLYCHFFVQKLPFGDYFLLIDIIVRRILTIEVFVQHLLYMEVAILEQHQSAVSEICLHVFELNKLHLAH